MIHYNNTRTCYRFDITDDVTGAVIGAATCYSAGADFLAAVRRDQQAERFARFVEQDDPTFADAAGAAAPRESGPPSEPASPRAYLCINAWYGRGEHPVEIVKETPKRYLVRILRDDTLVPGGRRLQTGETVYVPRHAVKFVADEPPLPSVEHVTTDEPCATIWCDRPATVRYHGTPLCYGCGMEAEQALDDAPPAVDTTHDPAAVVASILEQQTALMAIPPLELEANDTVVKEQRGVAALIKRSAPGYRKRVNTYHVLFLEDGRWVKDATSGLKKDAERAYRGYTYVPDVSAANWSSESKEAA